MVLCWACHAQMGSWTSPSPSSHPQAAHPVPLLPSDQLTQQQHWLASSTPSQSPPEVGWGAVGVEGCVEKQRRKGDCESQRLGKKRALGPAATPPVSTVPRPSSRESEGPRRRNDPADQGLRICSCYTAASALTPERVCPQEQVGRGGARQRIRDSCPALQNISWRDLQP